MNHTAARTKKLIYKEETYKIIGIIYEVYNQLKYGYREKFYQEAIAQELEQNNIKYKKELYVPLYYKKKKIGKYFIDFLIDGKIALEIKVANEFYDSHIAQLLSYLEASNIKLGIIAIITPKGVEFKRIVN
jgi:GxxExxY protein